MKPWRKRLNWVRQKAPSAVALLCAVFMLSVVPLLFRNAFFDINRFKVSAVCHVIPVFAAVMALVWVIRGQTVTRGGSQIPRWPCLFLLLFLLAGLISYVRSGFLPEVLTGSTGRYCGLFFLLCCAAGFFIIVLGTPPLASVHGLAVTSAVLCAVLGLLNAVGIDPLGFYTLIRPGQESTYLGTIGNMDFYGAYLAMIFPLAAGVWIFGRGPLRRLAGAGSAAVIAAGAFASRTDSSFLAVQFSCLALAALSGDDLRHLARALLIWGVACLALPAVYALLQISPYHPKIDGLPGILYRTNAAFGIAGVLVLSGLVVLYFGNRGAAAPGRKRSVWVAFCLLVVSTVLLLGAIVYFTALVPDADLGSAGSLLHFDEQWGSGRGFIYMRSIQAYSDYPWTDKLLGKGIDRVQAILEAYSEHQVERTGGIVNDAHNQLLQMLLTCGAFGAVAFAAFYLSTLFIVLRGAGQDSLLCGAFCSLFGYAVIMLLNATQPILICTYISLCAIAVARLRTSNCRKG